MSPDSAGNDLSMHYGGKGFSDALTAGKEFRVWCICRANAGPE